MDIKNYLDDMFDSTLGPIMKSIKDISEEESLERGLDKTNHIRWIAGHLLGSAGLTLKILKGKPSFPEEWNKLFIRAAEFSEDSSVYPSLEDIRENLKKINTDIRAALKACELDYLETETDIFPQWTTTPAKAILFLLQHDFYHLGQIATQRRILGRERLFG